MSSWPVSRKAVARIKSATHIKDLVVWNRGKVRHRNNQGKKLEFKFLPADFTGVEND